jgi:TonB family protein
MKIVLTFLICWFFSANLFSQILIDSSYTDTEGICWKGSLSNGKMNGVWTGRDCITRNVLVVVNYVDGNKDGEEFQLNTFGKTKVIYRYKNGLLEGPAVYYYGNTGDTLGCVNYTNGIINGQWRICDTTGRTMRFVEWEMGAIKTAFPKVDKFTRNEPPRNYRDYAALTAEIMHNELPVTSQDAQTDTAGLNKSDSIYTRPEVMPEFIGGQDSLIRYLQQNVKYPKLAKEAGRQGTIYIQYVVTKTGEVTDVRIAKGVDNTPQLGAEALRVVKEMPDWKPGENNGQPVSVMMVLPIRFVLKGPERRKKKNKRN